MQQIVKVLTVVAIMLSASFASFAAERWYICEVVKAGYNGFGQTYISLTHLDGGFEDKAFRAPDGSEKGMLAVALTAMTQGMLVEARVDPLVDGFPRLQQIRLILE